MNRTLTGTFPLDVSTWARAADSVQLWSALVHDSANPVHLWDAEGVLVFCNRRAAEMIGADEKDLVGRGVEEFLPGEVGRERRDFLNRVLRGERPLVVVEAIGGVSSRTVMRLIPPTGEQHSPLVLAQMFAGADAAKVSVDPSRYDIVYARHNQAGPLASLSEREVEVLRLIGLGLTTGQIAQRLGRSIKTIESHRARLGRKLDIASRSGLALLALQLGLVEIPAMGSKSEEVTGPIVHRPAGVSPGVHRAASRHKVVDQSAADLIGTNGSGAS